MSFEEALLAIGHQMRRELPSPMATVADEADPPLQSFMFLSFFEDDAARHRIERALNTAYLTEYIRRPEALSSKEREFVKRALLGASWVFASVKSSLRDTGGIGSFVASLAAVVHIFAGEFNAVKVVYEQDRLANNFKSIVHSLSKIDRARPSDRLPATELALVREAQSVELDDESWEMNHTLISTAWTMISNDAHVRAAINGALYNTVRGKFLF